MFEWLIGHAISGLYSLLAKTVLRPMIWSGQRIRCAREEIRAMEITLDNTRLQSPGASPTPKFLQHRQNQLWIIGLHSAFWLIFLSCMALWIGSAAGPISALLVGVLVICGYFNVNVSGMPSRIDPRRK